MATISSTAFSSFNTLVLGFATTNKIVGYYVAAEKLFIAMRGLINPIASSLYPFMAYAKNMLLYKKIFWWSMAGSLVVGSVAWFGSDLIVLIIFGEGFELTAELLRVFAFIVPVSAASLLIGYPLLAALGHEKFANYSNIGGAGVHLILMLAILTIITPTIVALVLLVTEVTVLSIKLYGVKRYKLWR